MYCSALTEFRHVGRKKEKFSVLINTLSMNAVGHVSYAPFWVRQKCKPELIAQKAN